MPRDILLFSTWVVVEVLEQECHVQDMAGFSLIGSVPRVRLIEVIDKCGVWPCLGELYDWSIEMMLPGM